MRCEEREVLAAVTPEGDTRLAVGTGAACNCRAVRELPRLARIRGLVDAQDLEPSVVRRAEEMPRVRGIDCEGRLALVGVDVRDVDVPAAERTVVDDLVDGEVMDE